MRAARVVVGLQVAEPEATTLEALIGHMARRTNQALKLISGENYADFSASPDWLAEGGFEPPVQVLARTTV